MASIDRLLEYEVNVIDFGQDCAQRFGSVRIELRRNGIEVSTTDLMIGCVALEYDFSLVTHNTVDFRNIPGVAAERLVVVVDVHGFGLSSEGEL